MTYLQALTFGLLQGITEFLPVSSSGHLVLLRTLFRLRDVPRLFDVILHGATLLVVFTVFRRRIGELLAALFRFLVRQGRPEDGPRLRLVGVILLATILTGVIGLSIKDIGAENHPKLVSAFFLVSAAFLVFSGRRPTAGGESPRGENRGEAPGPGVKEAIVVGVAQGIGVLPGISRSGATISAALLTGMDRREAGEFSFLLSIPAVLGALILESRKLGELTAAVSPGPLAAGFAAAFITGFLALRLLLGLVRRGRLGWFALYLVPLGIGGLFFL